jgi:pyruvate dehydrogenase kinase 2/3/4
MTRGVVVNGASNSIYRYRRRWHLFVDAAIVEELGRNFDRKIPNRHEKLQKRKMSSLSMGNNSDSSTAEEYMVYLMSQRATPLSLSTMYKYATGLSHQRLANAQFLHRELQVRISHRIRDLQSLPLISGTSHIINVCEKYREYLVKLKCFPVPKTKADEAAFTHMLQQFVLDRHTIPTAIAEGLLSTLGQQPSSVVPSSSREGFHPSALDTLEYQIQKFMMARVGLRFLTEHHVLCSPDIDVDAFRRQQGYLHYDTTATIEIEGPYHHQPPSKGAISTSVDPVREVKLVARQVMQDCTVSFGVSPEIHVVDYTGSCTFTYVPHHLHYIMAELLKNSCRAVLKKHWKPYLGNNTRILTSLQRSAKEMIPPVRVVVAKGDEDITIKISDRGGGIPRSTCEKIWTFVHSTLVSEADEKGAAFKTRKEGSRNTGSSAHQFHAASNFDKNAFTNQVHGRSFGLPLAKIYAQYLGGELTIRSMEGVGVDAYLYIPVLGVECEHLPERVYRSPGNLDSSLNVVSSAESGKKNSSLEWTQEESNNYSSSKETVVLT